MLLQLPLSAPEAQVPPQAVYERWTTLGSLCAISPRSTGGPENLGSNSHPFSIIQYSFCHFFHNSQQCQQRKFIIIKPGGMSGLRSKVTPPDSSSSSTLLSQCASFWLQALKNVDVLWTKALYTKNPLHKPTGDIMDGWQLVFKMESCLVTRIPEIK